MKRYIAAAALALFAIPAVTSATPLKEITQFSVCLLSAASDGDYIGSYQPNDAGSLARMIKQCPNTYLDYVDACQREGAADEDCRLDAMLMAMSAAERFKR